MRNRTRTMGLAGGLAVACALAIGCTGELTPYDPLAGTDNAADPNLSDPLVQQVFTEQVQPLLNLSRVRGSCAQCHQADLAGTGPFFMGASPADNVAAMLRYPNLLIPGNAAASRLQNYGPHTGDALLPVEADTVSNWILMLR